MLDTRWRDLYKLGGIAALIIAALLLGEIAVYALIPNPATTAEHFALFHNNWLAGLLSLDLLGMLAYLLFVPVILAFYMALWQTNGTVMIVAVAFFFVGIADFFATNTAFTMLSLSNQYAAATSEVEKAAALAAGQGMLTLFDENAFLVSYVIVSASWAMISTVMLRGNIFSRSTAYAGILAGAAGILAVLLEHILKADLVFIAIALYFAAIVFLFAWVVLAGRRLYRISNASGAGAGQ